MPESKEEEPPCARVSLSVSQEGGIMSSSKVVLQWNFELGRDAHTIALTASLKKKKREIEVDGELLCRGDGTAFRSDSVSRFSFQRHGHSFALEERLDLPKGAEAARRFRLSIDDVPFDVSGDGCVATLKGKRGSWPKQDAVSAMNGLHRDSESKDSESKCDEGKFDNTDLKISNDRAAESLSVDSIGMSLTRV